MPIVFQASPTTVIQRHAGHELSSTRPVEPVLNRFAFRGRTSGPNVPLGSFVGRLFHSFAPASFNKAMISLSPLAMAYCITLLPCLSFQLMSALASIRALT